MCPAYKLLLNISEDSDESIDDDNNDDDEECFLQIPVKRFLWLEQLWKFSNTCKSLFISDKIYLTLCFWLCKLSCKISV